MVLDFWGTLYIKFSIIYRLHNGENTVLAFCLIVLYLSYLFEYNTQNSPPKYNSKSECVFYARAELVKESCLRHLTVQSKIRGAL